MTANEMSTTKTVNTNMAVAQRYPGSHANTITLKLVQVTSLNGSLSGEWVTFMNEDKISTYTIKTVAQYQMMKAAYDNGCESLELTGICEATRSLKKY
tara:strand:+ start:389 stop:682 length:294 start_codon:yes stop_codon:yes gene_type:complete